MKITTTLLYIALETIKNLALSLKTSHSALPLEVSLHLAFDPMYTSKVENLSLTMLHNDSKSSLSKFFRNPTNSNEKVFETYQNVKQEIRDQLNAEAEAVQIILTGIDNDIYSIVDACPNAYEMWKAIEWLKQGKAIVNSPHPMYDQESSMVDDDDEMSKEKEIDKLMALISLSRSRKSTNYQQQPVYHPQTHPTHYTQNSSTRSQQAATRNRGKAIDNSPRINRNVGYENQRNGTVAGARETVGLTVVQKSSIQCYNCKEFGHVVRECQKPKRAKDAACHRENMLLCKKEEAGIQLNAEQADWRDCSRHV
nr:Gag-Pol polyprotein [Tanacetum cinerariifolium]